MNTPSFIDNFMVAHKTLAKMLRIPYVLQQTGIPIILPSSGTIGNNGALTLTTALPKAYTASYQYFPANAISAGSAAGLYYVVMSTTTAGTIYNNTYTSGNPAAPTSPTAFVTTGPGAYTQTTGSEIDMLSVTIPGGAIGANGSMLVLADYIYPNNANAKTRKVYLGATNVSSSAPTTTVFYPLRYVLKNKNNQAVNFSNEGGFSASASAPNRTTVNTASDVTLKHTHQLANAADYLILETHMIEIFPTN